jgi:putative FmdB family regulatory protein
VPTYQYICTECEHSFEVTQAFTDSTVPTCPECNGIVRKVFSSVGVVFKGSGFYRTDSRGAATSSSTPAGTSTPAATSTPTPTTPAPASTPTAPSTGTK